MVQYFVLVNGYSTKKVCTYYFILYSVLCTVELVQYLQLKVFGSYEWTVHSTGICSILCRVYL